MAKKYCYLFSEGNANMRELLGGKGANLAEMTNIGLPVPQGFTITTEACTQYYEDNREINPEIMAEINEYIVKMEEITGKKFGDKENPLLVSVRSGARASMPGMMDTILNLGLNEEVVETIAAQSGNPRWAWDCYRRFIQMYSDVVMEVGKKYFEELIDEMKAKKGVKQDVELNAEDLKELANQFKAEYKSKIGSDFPTDPKEQLMGAIKAVFRSWDNPRANVYRRDNDIPYSWGTAVNVQSMAFGNMGDDCGTGVAFTRDPATGAKGLFGEFLTNAQGEDVVAGVRTPMHISEMEQKFPEAFAEFNKVCKTLEDHYRDMQDMEFTVEHGKLYMLQTRNGKRTAQAALKIACDLVDEGMRTEEEAVAMIDPRNLDTLLHPQFDAKALKAATPMGKGLGASPGAACGKIVFTADERTYEPEQRDTAAKVTEGNIRFENVSFSYDGKHQILDNISFSVNKGETIAFVGSTGSGKSSIINVLMRFYEFQSGRVLLDGVDIRDYSQAELRKNIGLVLQDPFLYHGTIKSNIAMYQDLTDEEIKAAAEFVDANHFIDKLPEGYDSPVSERGSSFSTGQRQLLAFARTVASQPKILILDEATANIDSETEAIVQNSLAKMRQGRTTIAIAHRLSTIQDANCIYVLDKGRIIEHGSHEELLALGGTYHKMYSLQAGTMEGE